MPTWRTPVQGGIAALHGRARLLRPRTLRVRGGDIEADPFVIAPGARPVTLHFPVAVSKFLQSVSNEL